MMKFSVFKSSRDVNFNKALIIDSDDHFKELLEAYCFEVGFEAADKYNDFESAWVNMQKTKYDLIIIDWSAKGKLLPSAFFNRLKLHPSFKNIAVIVCTGFKAKGDFRLVHEFPFTWVIEKPFPSALFQETLEEVATEMEWFKSNKSKLSKLLKEVIDSPEKTDKVLAAFVRSSKYPEKSGLIMGQALYAKGKYEQAEMVYKSLSNLNRKNVTVLNELGKTLAKQQKFEEAYKVLKKASSMSPDNMKRLCMMGEISLKDNSMDAASAEFGQAAKIDPFYTRAAEGLKLAETSNEYFAEQDIEAQSIEFKFASLMNTIGIAKVRASDVKDGLEHYKSALYFIDTSSEKAKVMFNIGLGYLRAKLDDEALEWFVKSSEESGGSFSKVEQYIGALKQRIEKIESGELVMAELGEDEQAHSADDLDIFSEEENAMVFDDKDLDEASDEVDFSDIDPDFLLEDIDEEGLV